MAACWSRGRGRLGCDLLGRVDPPAADHALYELKVAPDDLGKVIGRDGRTINALRTVVTHAAQKKGEKIRLELVDDRRAPQHGAAASVP